MAANSLAYMAKEHWKEHRPQMYKRLKAQGTLEQEAMRAAEKTLFELRQLKEQGMPDEQAWELVQENYILLPEEDEEKERYDRETRAMDKQGQRMKATVVDLNRMLRVLSGDKDYEDTTPDTPILL